MNLSGLSIAVGLLMVGTVSWEAAVGVAVVGGAIWIWSQSDPR